MSDGEFTLVTPGGKVFTAFGEPFRVGEIVGGFVVDHVEGQTVYCRLPENEFEESAYAAWLDRRRD